MYQQVSGFRYSGSLALDMCYVASGYFDVVWNACDAKIWDIAAGALMIKEAGGMLCSLDGGLDVLLTGRFIAGNPKVVLKVLQFIKPHLITN